MPLDTMPPDKMLPDKMPLGHNATGQMTSRTKCHRRVEDLEALLSDDF